MIFRMEQVKSDNPLGYEWIEVLDYNLRLGNRAEGTHTASIVCSVRTNAGTASMCWVDIEAALDNDEYRIVS